MDRVAIDHRIMGGVACVRGTRIPVATILGLLGEGLTPADVLTEDELGMVVDFLRP